MSRIYFGLIEFADFKGCYTALVHQVNVVKEYETDSERDGLIETFETEGYDWVIPNEFDGKVYLCTEVKQ